MIKRKMFLSFHSVIIYVWETYNGSGSTDALCYKKNNNNNNCISEMAELLWFLQTTISRVYRVPILL